MITKDNFYTTTRAIFSECNKPETSPDFISVDKRTGEPSSYYWYTQNGVVRTSNHWGEVASCIWTLKGYSKNFTTCQVFSIEKTGYCSFEDMFNTTEKFGKIIDSGVRKYKETNPEFFSHRDAINFYWDELIQLFELNNL